MLNERDSADLMNRLANQADEIHQARLGTEIETAEYNLFVTLKPKFGRDGDKHYVILGDKQEGVAGLGDTLYLAILDFNRSFHKKIEERINGKKNVEPEVNYPEKFETIKKAAKPLIKYLCENHNPHVTAIVTGISIELVEGLISIPKIYDYLVD